LWRMADGNLGRRMRTARKRAGLSLDEVGKRVAAAINRPAGPFTVQAVQQWEVGTKRKGGTIYVEPDTDTLKAFATVVGCKLTWLITGVEVEESGGSAELPKKGRVVAIISPEQASQKPIDYETEDHIYTAVNCSKTTFGFEIFDTRNSPEFEPGDRVLIDPTGKKEPGVMVFAVVRDEPIFARYTKPQKRGSSWTCVLEPLSSNWNTERASSKDGDRIVGVMVDHSKPGSHPRYGKR
jgi:transcriptional regulator with XRE-family HTH domain